MEVQLTVDQQAFVHDGIASGRFSRPEQALEEALQLWESRERARTEILCAIRLAEDEVARGEGRRISEESMRELASEVKQRGRARLAAERQNG